MMNQPLSRREALRLSAGAVTAAALGVLARPSSSVAAGVRAADFNVRDYGAVGDGQTLDTAAIQAAIDACAAAGGGTIVVPSGAFLTGAIFLKQGTDLRIDAGGELRGSLNRTDYPLVHSRWEGIERDWLAALVNADGLSNVRLGGQGTINGQGVQWTAQMAQQRRARRQSGRPPLRNDPVLGMRIEAARPRLICLQNCTGIDVRELTLRDQASWCLHLLYSSDVTVDGLTIRAAHNIPSSDGIDVDSCNGVRISHVDIDVNDDCISIKSGKDADGLRVNRPSENIIVENSIFRYGHGGVAMGSETSGGIRNVETRDCVMEAGNWAPIRFKSQPSRGGVVENITYRNLELKDTKQAFEFNMEWRMVPPIAPPAKVLPVVRNVQIDNVSGTVTSVGLIHGLEDSPIQGVTFTDCTVTAQKGLVIENVEDLDLSGLTLHVAEGPAIIRHSA